MAEKDPKLPEIMVRELRQDGRDDVAVTERLLIALQPKFPQPDRDSQVGVSARACRPSLKPAV
jgi:hypothetical protein